MQGKRYISAVGCMPSRDSGKLRLVQAAGGMTACTRLPAGCTPGHTDVCNIIPSWTQLYALMLSSTAARQHTAALSPPVLMDGACQRHKQVAAVHLRQAAAAPAAPAVGSLGKAVHVRLTRPQHAEWTVSTSTQPASGHIRRMQAGQHKRALPGACGATRGSSMPPAGRATPVQALPGALLLRLTSYLAYAENSAATSASGMRLGAM